MAIGFTPSYSEELYFEDFTAKYFLITAVETAKQLNWRIDFISETGFIAYTNTGRFRWNANVTFKMHDEKATVTSESAGNEMIDLGRNRKMVNKFTNAFSDLKYSLNAESTEQKFEEIQASFVDKEHDVLSQSPATSTEKIKSFFSLFIPRNGYYITPLIVDVNILVFILMVISGVSFMDPSTKDLIGWGANFRPVTLEGQWWRLITNCFLHIGVLHLLFNMYALVYIGLLLEPRLGKLKFATAYFLTGIAASFAVYGGMN